MLVCLVSINMRPVFAAPKPTDPVAYSVIEQVMQWVAGMIGKNPLEHLETEAKTLTLAINELNAKIKTYTEGNGISISEDNVISVRGLPDGPGNPDATYVYQYNQGKNEYQVVQLDMAVNWADKPSQQ